VCITHSLRKNGCGDAAAVEGGQRLEWPARVRQHRRDRVRAVVRDRDKMVSQSRTGSRESNGDKGGKAAGHVGGGIDCELREREVRRKVEL
jgi:hypothetical protein